MPAFGEDVLSRDSDSWVYVRAPPGLWRGLIRGKSSFRPISNLALAAQTTGAEFPISFRLLWMVCGASNILGVVGFSKEIRPASTLLLATSGGEIGPKSPSKIGGATANLILMVSMFGCFLYDLGSVH